MRFTLTVLEKDYNTIFSAIFSRKGLEGACYLICSQSVTENERRFLVREVVPVEDKDYLVREPYRLSIGSNSYAGAAKRALLKNETIVFVHSHPGGIEQHSDQDDREEPKLMEFFKSRLNDKDPGSMVITDKPSVRGRVWLNNKWNQMDLVRVLGDKFIFFNSNPSRSPIPIFFDRQVRAFGKEIQQLLNYLHVVIVGTGGTGSIIFEQLVRLGIGKISIFDQDKFDPSNVNRVYGSRTRDDKKNKARMIGEHGVDIGIGNTIVIHESHINDENTAKLLRDADIVFGCTDKQKPRAILNALSLQYLIPVIDVGVLIESPDQIIKGIYGRVTTVLPGEACLICREHITARGIELESKTREERESLFKEGYAPELKENNPAVIPFTSAVGSQGVTELIHRLTGFMGEDRKSSETIFLFHENQIKSNRTPSALGCLCTKKGVIGCGDQPKSFLNLYWNGWS